MLGTEENALFIRDWCLTQREKEWTPDPVDPEGWTRLGSGRFREVYMGPDGHAYKVQHRYGRGESQSNASEAGVLRRHMLTKLPKGCRFPRWYFHELDGRGVMVMERFQRIFSYLSWDEKRDYENLVGPLERALEDVGDLHHLNLAVDLERKLLVPIDLGSDTAWWSD